MIHVTAYDNMISNVKNREGHNKDEGHSITQKSWEGPCFLSNPKGRSVVSAAIRQHQIRRLGLQVYSKSQEIASQAARRKSWPSPGESWRPTKRPQKGELLGEVKSPLKWLPWASWDNSYTVIWQCRNCRYSILQYITVSSLYHLDRHQPLLYPPTPC